VIYTRNDQGQELKDSIHQVVNDWFNRYRGESRLKNVSFDVRVTFYDPEDVTEVINGRTELPESAGRPEAE